MNITMIRLQKYLSLKGLQQTDATLTEYIPAHHAELPTSKRHALLICPGGGYRFVSAREGEPVALVFLEKGYNVYVLDYSTKDKNDNRFPTQLFEGMAAVKYIKDHALENDGTPEDIHVLGFSAGGHLAAAIGLIGNDPDLKTQLGLSAATDLSVKTMSLAYPVISHQVPTHAESFDNIVSDAFSYDALSLENYVRDQSPELFVFASSNDTAVPIQNALALVNNYAEIGKSFELHIYQKAPHGFSLANGIVYPKETAADLDPLLRRWPELMDLFIQRNT